ncbi:hypothetical protein KCU65_g41, partial [Aureobasidium melanogenum]
MLPPRVQHDVKRIAIEMHNSSRKQDVYILLSRSTRESMLCPMILARGSRSLACAEGARVSDPPLLAAPPPYRDKKQPDTAIASRI